jgi:hypothetical protein
VSELATNLCGRVVVPASPDDNRWERGRIVAVERCELPEGDR